MSDTFEITTSGIPRSGLHRVSTVRIGDEIVKLTSKSIDFSYKPDIQSGAGSLRDFIGKKFSARFGDEYFRMNAR